MDSNLLIILATILACFVLSLLLIRHWLKSKAQSDHLAPWLQSLQASIDAANRNLNEALRGSSMDVAKLLSENSRQLNERLDRAAQVIGDVQKNLGEMSELGRGIKTLQDFLQSPKLRGGLGEEVLSDMLGQVFPKSVYSLQYSFKSGAKVDAVIKTEAGLLCVDSKFPLGNFTAMLSADTESARSKARSAFVSDVKKHLDDISKKYILPAEGTLDFALMYIPSENVYYEVVDSPELIRHARAVRVYPVSPNTLYAHLQVLFTSFQGKQLEAKTREVFQILRALQADYDKVCEHLSTLTRHVTNSYNQLTQVNSSFSQIGQSLYRARLLPEPS